MHRAVLLLALLLTGACSRSSAPLLVPREDHILSPHFSGSVHEIKFQAPALSRTGQYIAILPAHYDSGKTYPVLYLLHGAFGAPKDWLKYSHLLDYLEGRELIVVLPDGGNAYYVNSARGRWEDFITRDVVADVEAHYPTISSREGRFVGGLSMGGYAAVLFGLHHPDRYSLVGGFSSAVDITRRSFTPRRFGQSWRLYRIFGLEGSSIRIENDVFHLAPNSKPGALPYFYLSCGAADSLLDVNRRFAHVLGERGIGHEFHQVPGGHEWAVWDGEIGAFLTLIQQRQLSSHA